MNGEARPFSLLLLDRDGVINVDLPGGVCSCEEFVLLPQVPQAIARLNRAGILVAVVTNQANVGRGLLSAEGLNDIHDYLQTLLAPFGAVIDHFFICTDAAPSPRRKPAPGMIFEALHFFNKTPSETLMIGDAPRDLQAATAAGCPFALVKTGKGAETLKTGFSQEGAPWKVFDNLFKAVDFLSEWHPLEAISQNPHRCHPRT